MLDDEKKFFLLLEELKDVNRGWINSGVKISGILIIVIGWFAASNNPLTMLCQSEALAYAALVCVVAGEGSLIVLSHSFYMRSGQTHTFLRMLESDESLYQRYSITPTMYVIAIFGHFAMMAGIFLLIYYKYVFENRIACG